MAAIVAQDSDLALQLQNLVQPKLVEVGWSAGDSTLAEYIVLMLVNGKDKDQVALELSNDLLGLEPGDESTKEFAQWLFDQVALLSGHGPTSSEPLPAQGAALEQSIPTESAPGADVANGMDVEQTQSIPTGPKSMRSGSNGQRGNGRRIVGHANRAMDRSNDSMLHKVRNNSTERIGRHPPRGPRGGMQGSQFKGAGNGQSGRGGPHLPQINPQQQNQLMQFMNQQFEMMQQMLSGQGGQGMMNMNGASINPNFRGRSLADRVNGGQRGGGKFGDRKGNNSSNNNSNNHNNNQNANGNNLGGHSTDAETAGDSAMETDSTANNQPNAEMTVCRFNLKCTKADCPFAHQSPAAPPGTTIDTSDTCTYGAACQNHKCVAKHPSPAKRTQFQAEQECKYWPNCTNVHCPFKHPKMPMCRFGGDCTNEDCKYTHIRTLCKYNPCMNPNCYFKHEDGQKKDSKWVNKEKDGDVKMGAEHVSERKFVNDGGDQGEELIKPTGVEPIQSANVAT